MTGRLEVLAELSIQLFYNVYLEAQSYLTIADTRPRPGDVVGDDLTLSSQFIKALPSL